MPQSRRRAGDVAVQRRRAMAGQIDVMRLAQSADLQKAGDAAAAGRVGLQHVDGARLQHAARRSRACSRIRRRRSPLRPGARSRISAQARRRSSDETGSSNQRISASAQASREIERLLRPRRRRWRRRKARARRSPIWPALTRSGSRSGSLPIFILTKRQPSRSTQPESWSRSSVVRIGGEAAAAIDRHRDRGSGRAASRAAARAARAFRSHSAVSTAEIAHRGQPAAADIAHARCIAIQQPGDVEAVALLRSLSRAMPSISANDRARRRRCSRARSGRRPRRRTTTSVVASQAKVPSASGLSVGIR